MPLTFRTMLGEVMVFLGTVVGTNRKAGEGLSIGGCLAAAAPPAWREGMGRVRSVPQHAEPDGRSQSGLAILHVTALQLLVGQVLVRAGLDHRLDDLLVGLVPVGAHVPLAAVP